VDVGSAEIVANLATYVFNFDITSSAWNSDPISLIYGILKVGWLVSSTKKSYCRSAIFSGDSLENIGSRNLFTPVLKSIKSVVLSRFVKSLA